MAEDDACLVVFAKRGQLPKDLLNAVFAFLVVDPQTICTIQRTCCTTRHWNYDTLQEWKLDWMYKNVEEVLGARRTNQLRDGSLTSIYLRYTIIGAEGGKAIGEALKVNNSLTQIYLPWNEIGAEGGKAIGEALKVNTSLTEISLEGNEIGDEGGNAIGEALKVNTSLTYINLCENNIGDQGKKAIGEALRIGIEINLDTDDDY